MRLIKDCVGDPDIELFNKGYSIIGIDEAGRGPIAGSMFIGIVHFDKREDCESLGLRDSKKLSERKRRELEIKIKENCGFYRIIGISPGVIDACDNINVIFDQQVCKALSELDVPNSMILFDGNRKIRAIPNQIYKPKLDITSWHVAAASILAKTEQVKHMEELHEKYPKYGFDHHHGYGQKKHFEAIKKYGVIDEHRKSWIKPNKLL